MYWHRKLVLTEFALQLEQCVSKFHTFYNGKHSGRKLSWLYNRSKGDVIGNGYTKNRYTFQASTFQMAILLMYNNADSYKLSEIAEATKLKADILHQVQAIYSRKRKQTFNSSSSWIISCQFFYSDWYSNAIQAFI